VPLFDPPLLSRPDEWYCPNCDVTDVTAPLPPGSSRYHPCAGLHGLNAPLVRTGVRAEVRANEREDYLNGDTQPVGDDGKVYMAVETVRDDGTDVTVFAALAHAELRS
jgi:hypothetical protein